MLKDIGGLAMKLKSMKSKTTKRFLVFLGISILTSCSTKKTETDINSGQNDSATHITQKPDLKGIPEVPATELDPSKMVELSFDKAMILDDVPEDQILPPDKTIAGKSTALIRKQVELQWPNIRLLDEKGKIKKFTVLMETDLGTVKIALRPELSPNHVRNFVALIQTGYYDGLRIDRIVHQQYQSMDGTTNRLDLLRAGCPIGIGDEGIGHLGYWLKPEFSKTEKNETGTVGFWHDASPTSACCRFYIALDSAPLLDGEYTIIGKVVEGIDHLKEISKTRGMISKIESDQEKPMNPVIIHRMVVQSP